MGVIYVFLENTSIKSKVHITGNSEKRNLESFTYSYFIIFKIILSEKNQNGLRDRFNL